MNDEQLTEIILSSRMITEAELAKALSDLDVDNGSSYAGFARQLVNTAIQNREPS